MNAIGRLFYLEINQLKTAREQGNVIWYEAGKNKNQIFYKKVFNEGGNEFACYYRYKENCDDETAQEYFDDGLNDSVLDAVFHEVMTDFASSSKGIINMNGVQYSYAIVTAGPNKYWVKIKKA